jgi:hypothetical protein
MTVGVSEDEINILPVLLLLVGEAARKVETAQINKTGG